MRFSRAVSSLGAEPPILGVAVERESRASSLEGGAVCEVWIRRQRGVEGGAVCEVWIRRQRGVEGGAVCEVWIRRQRGVEGGAVCEVWIRRQRGVEGGAVCEVWIRRQRGGHTSPLQCSAAPSQSSQPAEAVVGHQIHAARLASRLTSMVHSLLDTRRSYLGLQLALLTR